MVVFSRLPSRLASRTHLGAYAEGSSRFPFPSTGLLMDASHTHRLHIPQLGRLICSFVMLLMRAPLREITGHPEQSSEKLALFSAVEGNLPSVHLQLVN